MFWLLLAAHAVLLALTAVNVVYWRRSRTRVAPLPAPPPRVSVLVPARNEEENLRRLLPSLLAQAYPAFEVVVVDDASEDGTAAVLAAHADPRLRVIRGDGPPPGWIGKVHACWQAAREARGDLFLFLDADAALTDPGALSRLAGRWQAAGGMGAALSGLPRYRGEGGGLLLTSLIPFALLSSLPLPLVPRTRRPALGALNGQCWLLAAGDYRRLDPHAAHPDEVLEDVMIGRYLKQHGLHLMLADLGGEVEVRMYRTLGEAWRGFRKNAFLLQGGRLLPFLAFHLLYVLLFVAAPLFGWPLLGTLYALKGATDRVARLPLWITLLTPLVLLGGALLQLDSALAHARGAVTWKGRRV
ncbi:MAG TPA: glycosyltransferase [Rubricoccaceae bacterium]|nr:glycosyltransferase [Rubricoccaceae bacterium]